MRDQVSHPYTTTSEVITDATEIIMKPAHRGLVYKSAWCSYSSRRCYGHIYTHRETRIPNLELIFLDFEQRMHKITLQLKFLYLITYTVCNSSQKLKLVLYLITYTVCNSSQKLQLVLSRRSPYLTLDTGECFGQNSKEPTLKKDEPVRPYLSRYTAPHTIGP